MRLGDDGHGHLAVARLGRQLAAGMVRGVGKEGDVIVVGAIAVQPQLALAPQGPVQEALPAIDVQRRLAPPLAGLCGPRDAKAQADGVGAHVLDAVHHGLQALVLHDGGRELDPQELFHIVLR